MPFLFFRIVQLNHKTHQKCALFQIFQSHNTALEGQRIATQHIYHDIKPEIYRPVLQLWNTLKSQFPAHKWKSIDFISQVMDDPGITFMAKIKVRTLTNDININCLMCETHIKDCTCKPFRVTICSSSDQWAKTTTFIFRFL